MKLRTEKFVQTEYQLLVTSYIKLFPRVRNKEIKESARDVCFQTKTNENPLNIPHLSNSPPCHKTQNKISNFILLNNSRNPAVKSKDSHFFTTSRLHMPPHISLYFIGKKNSFQVPTIS